MGIEGKWKLKISTPMGEQTPTLTLNADGSGTMEGAMGKVDIADAKVEGDKADFSVSFSGMGRSITIQVSASADGDNISGDFNTPMGNSQFSGQRVTE